jgi:RHS repeat-associated protein
MAAVKKNPIPSGPPARHVATFGGGTNFSHSDWLGTERLRTTYNGATCESISSLPFGDGLATTGACYHPSPLHLTGKPRDAATGLDYFGARFDSSNFGRFMSHDPDELAGIDHMDDPQSWNGYAYTRDNPLLYSDPDGMNYIVCEANGKNCADLTNKQYAQFLKNSPNIYSYGGKLYTTNENGTERKTGTVTYYNEKDVDAAAHIAGSQLLINEFVKQVAINVAIGAIGRGIGLGIEAIQAARAARAAAAAEAVVDIENLSSKIAGQIVSRGWTKQGILDTIQQAQEAGTTYPAVNKATGGAATEFVSQSTGKFVVVDNTTKQVIQVSGPGFKPNYLLK